MALLFLLTFPLKLLFHYVIEPRNKYVPLDLMLIYIFQFGCPGVICIYDLKTAEEVGRRRRPTSSVVISSFYRFSLGIQIKKSRLALYLMEHIYFEAQLCNEVATLKEKSQQIENLPKIVWLVEKILTYIPFGRPIIIIPGALQGGLWHPPGLRA